MNLSPNPAMACDWCLDLHHMHEPFRRTMTYSEVLSAQFLATVNGGRVDLRAGPEPSVDGPTGTIAPGAWTGIPIFENISLANGN